MKTPKEYKEMEFKNLILEMVHLFKPKTYVEIGVKKGYTFNTISSFVERAVAVDINFFKPLPPISGSTRIDVFQCTSKEFASKWATEENNQIDFLFIDADHKCESVLEDFNILSSFVPLHTGLIFLHDTYPINETLLQDGYCSTAWKAARTIYKYGAGYEIVTLPGPWAGLSIIRKVGNYHGWMDQIGEEE